MFEQIALRRRPSVPKKDVAVNLRLTLVEAGWSLELQQPFVIGRETGCDLRIDDARVARRHAEIYPVGTLWWVRDLGSDDGIYLNGEIIEAAPVEAPSELRLGPDGPTLRLDALDDSLQSRPPLEC